MNSETSPLKRAIEQALPADSYRGNLLGRRVSSKRSQHRDAVGEGVSVGNIVRVVGVPDLAGMSPECRAESLPVFEFLVGKYKRVAEFDQWGMAWLRFKIRKGPHAGYHSVGIEPCSLRVRRSRSNL